MVLLVLEAVDQAYGLQRGKNQATKWARNLKKYSDLRKNSDQNFDDEMGSKGLCGQIFLFQ